MSECINLVTNICSYKQHAIAGIKGHMNPNNDFLTITVLSHLVYSRVEQRDKLVQVKTYHAALEVPLNFVLVHFPLEHMLPIY